MDNNYKDKGGNGSRVFGGLILVGVGAALLLRNSGFPFPTWIFTWPMILILVGVYSGVKHNFRNNTWIILMAVGGFFLLDKLIPGLTLEPYFWPVAIIGLGLLWILKPRRSWYNNSEKKNDPGNITYNSWQQGDDNSSYSTDTNDFLKVSSVFSGVQRNIVSKNFQGGKIACVFGGADIDLTQADITGKKEIRLEIMFGGAKLILPPHWTVHNEIDGAFHGVDDKRKYNATTGLNPEKVLVLKGSVFFGGVELRSY